MLDPVGIGGKSAEGSYGRGAVPPAVSIVSVRRTARWLLQALGRLGTALIDSAAFSYQWVSFKFALSLLVLYLAFIFFLGLTVLESSSRIVRIPPPDSDRSALLWWRSEMITSTLPRAVNRCI